MDALLSLFGVLAIGAVNAVIGALIARKAGREGSGALWGFLLGPIGWLIACFLKDLRPKAAAPMARSTGPMEAMAAIHDPLVEWEAKHHPRPLEVPEHLKQQIQQERETGGTKKGNHGE